MKEVIRINQLDQKKEDKPVEFTYQQGEDIDGWGDVEFCPSEMDKIVYLGHCEADGDMFAGYMLNTIIIYKGNLNSGKY